LETKLLKQVPLSVFDQMTDLFLIHHIVSQEVRFSPSANFGSIAVLEHLQLRPKSALIK